MLVELPFVMGGRVPATCAFDFNSSGAGTVL
jgi:hypothetical protein